MYMQLIIHLSRFISSSSFIGTMRITTQQPGKVAAVLCLQAQRVAGLPAAAEGSHILLHLLQQQQVVAEEAAAARCRGGVAAFHDQVLLLHCAPVNSIASVVAVAVTVDDSRRHGGHTAASDLTASTTAEVDLAEQLRRPSPSVLSLVLGGAAATAGAVLSLTLHHRLITRRRSSCLPLPELLLNCLRVPHAPVPTVTESKAPASHNEEDNADGQSSSSGFITIEEKGTISRRRPPSDNLLTTDDEMEEVVKAKHGKSMCCWSLAEELEVEDEFLALLEADQGHDVLYLDALVKDAEAELASRRRL